MAATSKQSKGFDFMRKNNEPNQYLNISNVLQYTLGEKR